jgi:hypothetical protein
VASREEQVTQDEVSSCFSVRISTRLSIEEHDYPCLILCHCHLTATKFSTRHSPCRFLLCQYAKAFGSDDGRETTGCERDDAFEHSFLCETVK